MTAYKLTGNTYRNRAYLRQIGATWEPATRAWELNLGGNGADSRLRDLRRRGIVVAAV